MGCCLGNSELKSIGATLNPMELLQLLMHWSLNFVMQFEDHGMIKLGKSLHQQIEGAPNLEMISICEYANLALHHICVEIFVSCHESIVIAAQSLKYWNRDHFSNVNLWSQDSIIVTIPKYNSVHTQESRTNGSPIDHHEQAYLTCYGCTRVS
jgi:hypothetical protein